MKVFACTFIGYYAGGACAVVVAESAVYAKELLENKLKLIGLPQTLSPHEIAEINPDQEQVIIILDGNY